MALTEHTEQCLRNGLASSAAQSNLTTVINAGSGTIAQGNKEALSIGVASHVTGAALATKFSANTALSATTNELWRLAAALGSYTAALDIVAESA